MATKKPSFSDADLVVARNMLQNLRSKLKGLDELDKLVSLVENKDQVLRERRLTLAALNKEIAEREAHVIDGAVAEGKRQAEKIVAEARRQAESIMSNMNARRDAINQEVEAREADLGALNDRIEKAKAEVRRVLSAA